MNELLAQLRAAADNLHAALVVWENHIDHPGARTAIHSAARELLNAASVIPMHYDDGSERIKQLERRARVLEIRNNLFSMAIENPDLYRELTDA